jgi:high-affinity Fe2+/Pb2+ permease
VVTHWQFHAAAPAGLLAYLVMQALASLRHQNLSPIEQWIGYTLLAWSAGLCLWGVWRFRKVLHSLM